MLLPVSTDDSAALRLAAKQPATLCTIVGIDGSYSRRLGCQLAVGRDGEIVGSLADGCLERELAAQSRLAVDAGQPVVLRFGSGSPFVDFRLPCGSGLDILLDPAPDRAGLQAAVAALDRRTRATLPLPVTARTMLAARTYLPSLRLVVLGDNAEAAALVRLARACGADCVEAKPGDELALGVVPSHLPADSWTAIVLLFHDHEWEVAILEWALATEAFYVGAIGGRTARENRVEQLRARGCGPGALGRLRSPIGLIPAARDAGTLALGVLAEIVRDYEALR